MEDGGTGVSLRNYYGGYRHGVVLTTLQLELEEAVLLCQIWKQKMEGTRNHCCMERFGVKVAESDED